MTNGSNRSSALYIPHGGGPLPLMDHPGHHDLIRFLKAIPERLGEPDLILVISAHWEAFVPSVTGDPQPPIEYDYYGFPKECYQITYPAPGAPEMAAQIIDLLDTGQMKPRLDHAKGFDHGLFVPLKLMYPDASIPCLQLSLLASFDPGEHIAMGRALLPLLDDNILVLGSGFSFHNMGAFREKRSDDRDLVFDQWLRETLTDPAAAAERTREALKNWEQAPHARFCHPTEDHLLPLHVCLGMASGPAEVVFNDDVLGRRASAFLWQSD
ncbi:MAG: dioxygenase [Desulfobacteraceae bacterium]|nr:MAG: dioxygenase [Desulfobacteraceae bacterium]